MKAYELRNPKILSKQLSQSYASHNRRNIELSLWWSFLDLTGLLNRASSVKQRRQNRNIVLFTMDTIYLGNYLAQKLNHCESPAVYNSRLKLLNLVNYIGKLLSLSLN